MDPQESEKQSELWQYDTEHEDEAPDREGDEVLHADEADDEDEDDEDRENGIASCRFVYFCTQLTGCRTTRLLEMT